MVESTKDTLKGTTSTPTPTGFAKIVVPQQTKMYTTFRIDGPDENPNP